MLLWLSIPWPWRSHLKNEHRTSMYQRRHKGNGKQYESKAEQMAGTAVTWQPYSEYSVPLPHVGCITSWHWQRCRWEFTVILRRCYSLAALVRKDFSMLYLHWGFTVTVSVFAFHSFFCKKLERMLKVARSRGQGCLLLSEVPCEIPTVMLPEEQDEHSTTSWPDSVERGNSRKPHP